MSVDSQTQAESKDASNRIRIVVNGTEETVRGDDVTYDQIVAIGVALGLPTGPNILYTITYRKAESKPHEGDLAEGGTVKVKEGTIFNVTATDKS